MKALEERQAQFAADNAPGSPQEREEKASMKEYLQNHTSAKEEFRQVMAENLLLFYQKMVPKKATDEHVQKVMEHYEWDAKAIWKHLRHKYTTAAVNSIQYKDWVHPRLKESERVKQQKIDLAKHEEVVPWYHEDKEIKRKIKYHRHRAKYGYVCDIGHVNFHSSNPEEILPSNCTKLVLIGQGKEDPMRPKEIGIIGAGLANYHHNITSVDLSGQKMGDDGIEILANALTAAQVNHLVLKANRIGDQGAAALAKMIAVNHENGGWISSLDLRFNYIGTKGLKLLGAAAKQNPHIFRLELKGQKDPVTNEWLHEDHVGFKDPEHPHIENAVKGRKDQKFAKLTHDHGERFRQDL